MALKMRLRRMGSTGRPFYRIVVAEANMPRDGRFVDIVGHYNPLPEPAEIRVEEEKVYHWLRHGAQPTDTVRSLLSDIGVWRKWGLLKRGLDPSRLEEMATPTPSRPGGGASRMAPQSGEPVSEMESRPDMPAEEERDAETKE